MGRSPVLATVTVIVSAPAFNSISPSAGKSSPGIILASLLRVWRMGSGGWALADVLADGLVDGDQFGAVREGGLHLHVVDHLRDAFHDLLAGQHLRALFHERGHGLAVPRSLDDEVGDEGDGLRVVQLHAPFQAVARDHRGERYQQLVFFPGGEMHTGPCPQQCHTRGNVIPEVSPASVTRRISMARIAAPSAATTRRTASPSRRLAPTSVPLSTGNSDSDSADATVSTSRAALTIRSQSGATTTIVAMQCAPSATGPRARLASMGPVSASSRRK